MPFKHDNKEDEKQLVLHRIVSFRCISLHHVRQKKDNKDVIFKSDYLSRQNYTKPKRITPTDKRPCSCGEKKRVV